MSPSGFPLLQVINAEGTVSIILVCPAIALNTLLLPTVVPNAVHDGSIIVVRLVQPSKQASPAPTIHLALSSTFTRFVSF